MPVSFGLICLALLILACGGDGSDEAGTGANTTPDSDSPKSTVVAASPTQPTGSGQVNDEPVAFMTPDGVTIRGHLYTAPGPKRKAVILVHDVRRDQAAWQNFARELTADGIAALTFDLRGHGESGGGVSTPEVHADIETAVRFIRSRDYPQLYIAAEGISSIATILVAGREDLSGIVLVSSPPWPMGSDPGPALARVNEPKLFIASRGDMNAIGGLNQLLQAAPAPKQSQLFDGTAAGADILRLPAAKQVVLDFLSR